MILATMMVCSSALKTRPVTRTLAPVNWPTFAALSGETVPESPSSCSPRTFSNSARSTVMRVRLGGQVGVDQRGDFWPEIAHGFIFRFKIEDGDGENIGCQRTGNSAGQQQAGKRECVFMFHNLFVVYGWDEKSGKAGGSGFNASLQK